MLTRWTRPLGRATVAIAVIVLAPAPDAQRAATRQKAAALTPMDYIEIQQLVARYGYALDTGAPEGTGNDYSGLFTSDGEFVGPGIPDNTQGSEKLAALARLTPGRGRRGPTYVSHFLLNHLIEPTPEGARGKVYIFIINFGENGSGGSFSMAGHYEDEYRKTPAGWRFRRREFVRGKVARGAAEPVPGPAVVASPAPAKTAAGAKGTLTPMDYVEIRKLVANYAYALDTGADNGYRYADLFAPGGVVFGGVTGRENIAALARREPHGPDYVRHFLTNVVIEPTAEGARGRQYLAVIDVGENGKPSAFFLGGKYEDTYVRTPGGWRFKTRTLVRAIGAAPPARGSTPSSGSAPGSAPPK